MLGLLEVALADIDLQQMVLAGAGADALLARDQVAGHQREQVAGLGEGVFPPGQVTAVVQRRGLDEVAVGQQHRVAGLVGAQRDRVDRHHVGAVEEVGDAAEALGLALREEAAARGVEARQRGVLVRRAGVADLQREVRVGHVVDDQLMAFLAEGHALAVDQHAQQVELLAMQAQRAVRHRGVALQAHLAGDQRLGRIEVEAQVDGADPEDRRDVVGAADQGGGAFTHGGLPCWN